MLGELGIMLDQHLVILPPMESDPPSENHSDRDTVMTMTSTVLQCTFPEMYKDFFHTHDMVMSASGVLTWWPNIAHGVSTVRVKQKLPLKTFCGVNFNDSGKVTFRTLFVYDIQENHFKKKDFQEVFRHDIDPLILFLEESLQESGYHRWVEIDFLSEAPPWHGFTFSSVFSVLLAVVLHALTEHLSPDAFKEREFPNNHPLFEKIYIFSLVISHRISPANTMGWWSNYAVIVANTIEPIVYLSRKPTPYNRRWIDILSKQTLEDTLYKGSLLEFLNISPLLPGEFPLDYGVLFMGREYRFGEGKSSKGENMKAHIPISSFTSDALHDLTIDEEKWNKLRDILSFDGDEVLHKTIDSMNLRILLGFYSLLKNTNSTSVDSFIEMLGQIGLSSFAYHKENIILSDMLHFFHKFQQFSDEKIAILPFNTGKIWGSLLFVMQKWYSIKTLEKSLTELKAIGHNVSLYHASWRDGYASDGVRLEQYITKEVYSPYTKKWDVRYRDSHGSTYCGNYDAIVEHETRWILLDTIAWRVYVRGEKLTSRDIHSQSTTIDMLSILLEHIWEEVPNTKLPVSTYSQNKNEILGKVVFPIRKIAIKYFQTELSLFCSGGITEYYLRLEKDDEISIGIIQKL